MNEPIGGGKVDHPLTDPSRVEGVVAAMWGDDSIAVAKDAFQWLESISAAAEFSLPARYAVIDRIDVSIKRHGQRLLEQYLALKPQSMFQERQLWKAAADIWKALGDAYGVCIAQAGADAAAAAAFRATLPALLARAMRAQTLQIKWILMRYGYVDDGYWHAVAGLYRHAESGGFLDAVVDIYGGAHGRGSVRQEFLRALMLGVSSTGGLSPIQQNIAERAIAHFSGHFESGMLPGEGRNFLFDLNGGHSPARALGVPVAGVQLFYFGAGGALDGAQKIIDAILESGEQALLDIDLGPGENIDRMADTLTHLAFNWEKELPLRDSERREVNSTLQVTQGFDGVLALGQRVVQETWMVDNASAEGYGLIVPARRGEWLQVGVLIGILPEGEPAAWGAGVVRRVESDGQGQRRVGIQVLSRRVVPATMTLRGADAGHLPQTVVFLDAEPSQSGYWLALLRPGSLVLRDAFEATRVADGMTFIVTPSGLVESGPDFDRVRFKTA